MSLLNFSTAVAIWLVFTCTFCFCNLPYENVLTGNLLVSSLIFFNNLNIWVAACEIILGVHITYIQEYYKHLREKYKGKERDGCLELLTRPLTIKECFSYKPWAMMWSTYALYDPSYQNHESFGFFIDVGNGFSTIIPCILVNMAMICPHRISSLLVGCVSLATYWQILYGTIIYFVSFFFNRRYANFKPIEIGLFVGLSNGIWFFFSSLGIYAAVCVLRDGNLDIFGA
mmetsp:Transcript_95/g.126  ORF Transcript_95/g.126 Transcript_95/m.126 type:complete len:229 (+) Transcript_95:49-735(+)